MSDARAESTNAGRPPDTTFGLLLRRYRLAAGLTQEALAERAGVGVRSIGDLERGVPHAPRRDTITLLAAALALDATERVAFEEAARRLSIPLSSAPSLLPVPVIPSIRPFAGRSPAAPFVFVSSAHDDSAFAARLMSDLAARGIAGWVDRHGLSAGTADWEEIVREAIRRCRAVLFIASPDARQSRIVKAELAVAGMYSCPIVPVWAAGEQWPDSVPFALSAIRYVDARGSRYAAALDHIVGALDVLAPLHAGVAAERADATLKGQEASRLGEGAIHEGAVRNPYKGLRPFTEEDTGDFFGRTAAIDGLLDALRTTLVPGQAGAARLLAVVGPSGSGKSSLVRAGLLPRLQRGGLPGSDTWVYLDPLVPGAHPLEALAVILASRLDRSIHALRDDLAADSARGLHLLARSLARRPRTQVVLVIDQFEEVFTLTASEEERRQFIDVLVAAVTEPAGPLLAVLTLRADFYDRPLVYPALGLLLETQGKAVLPLTVPDLREAIEKPAALPDVRLAFEPGLIGDLLFDVSGQAGTLPLLEFTLDQLVARRQGRTLTVGAYEAIGGVRGALTRHAEAAYAALPSDDHRGLARALFLRLIDPGATAQETTRRRAALGELTLPDAPHTALMHEVAGAFITARLLTTAESAGLSTVEVSHEALIGEWPRLADWLHAAREDIQRQQAISADAAAWAQRGQPPDNLYRGSVLLEACEWAERNTPSAEEATFLEAGLAESQRQEEAQRARQARELALARQAAAADRRAAVRSRTLAGVLGLFLLVAAGLTLIALGNAANATTARNHAAESAHAASLARATAVAERNDALASAAEAGRARTLTVVERNAALSGLSRALAVQAVALLHDQPQLALLLSVAASHLSNTAEARVSLFRTVADNPRLLRFLSGPASPVTCLAISPDGKLLASGSNDATVRLWDVATGRPRSPPLSGHTGSLTSVAFSPDGRLLASGSADNTIRLWDVARGRPLGSPLSGRGGGVNSVAFSPDGGLVAANNGDTIQLWDVARRQPRGGALLGHTDTINSLAFSPDGTILASGSSDNTIRLWDVARGRPLGRPLTGHSGPVNSVAFSPDGKVLASGSNDNTIRLWDVARRHSRGHPLTGHGGVVTSVAFSPDGKVLASGSNDNTIRLWDVATGQPHGAPLAGHTDSVTGVAFSPDGKLLASGSNDYTIRLWDMTGGRPLSALLIGKPGSATGGLAGIDGINGVDFSPDGKLLAFGINDGTAGLWDVAQRKALGPRLSRHADPREMVVITHSTGVAFSPNGKILVFGSGDDAIQVWDVATRQPFGPAFAGHVGPVNSVAFSPDGQLLASGSDNDTIRLWDVARRRAAGVPLTANPGAPLAGLGNNVVSVAFSPDGKLLASGSSGTDNTVRLWDVTTRRPLAPPLTGFTNGVNSVAFSPDGTILAAGSADDTIRLWDVASRQPLGPPLSGQSAPVSSLVFSPDGTILAAGGGDDTIRLWDVASRQPLGPPLTGHTNVVTSVAFSPDGTMLASGSVDSTVRLWNLNPALLARQACQMANRNMTPLEWRQYLGDEPYRRLCPGAP